MQLLSNNRGLWKLSEGSQSIRLPPTTNGQALFIVFKVSFIRHLWIAAGTNHTDFSGLKLYECIILQFYLQIQGGVIIDLKIKAWSGLSSFLEVLNRIDSSTFFSLESINFSPVKALLLYLQLKLERLYFPNHHSAAYISSILCPSSTVNNSCDYIKPI